MNGVKVETRVHVRWMIHRDLPGVLDIESRSFPQPWSEADYRECLRRRNCIGMVAVDRADDVLGFMIYELSADVVTVLNFAVHPRHRRQGIGEQLVAKLIGKLSPLHRSVLRVMVADSNLDGQLFFRAAGFLAMTVCRGWFDGEDGYEMEYRID